MRKHACYDSSTFKLVLASSLDFPNLVAISAVRAYGVTLKRPRQRLKARGSSGMHCALFQ
eukprot:5081345-Pleurochrysis_carterae.AAC.1